MNSCCMIILLLLCCGNGRRRGTFACSVSDDNVDAQLNTCSSDSMESLPEDEGEYTQGGAYIPINPPRRKPQ